MYKPLNIRRLNNCWEESVNTSPQVSLSYYDMNNWYCDKIDEGIQYEQSLTRQTPTFIDNEEQF